MTSTARMDQDMDDVSKWYNPFVAPQLHDPHAAWARLRQEAPVFFSEVLGGWVITRHADAVAVLSDFSTFVNSGGTRAVQAPPEDVQAILAQVPTPQDMDMLPSDPPRHTKLRNAMRVVLVNSRVAAMQARIEAIANELIDGFEHQGQCDFYHRFAYPFPLAVVCDMLGIPGAEHERLNRWALSNVNLRWGSMDHQAYLAAAQGRVDFYHYGERLIAARRRNPGPDILSELVAASDAAAEPLADRELVGQFMTLITAGHETSANWLTIGLYHLLRDGSAWAQVCQDPGVINRVVEETLRFTASSQAIWRTTSRATEVAGVRIPEGARVCVAIGSANRDAAVFTCPEQLDLQRPDVGRHVGFGWGIHFCLGAQLARLEGAVAFRLLAERLPGLRLQPGVTLSFKPNATLRVPEALPVAWDSR